MTLSAAGVMTFQAFPGVTPDELVDRVARLVDEGCPTVELPRVVDGAARARAAELTAEVDVTFAAYVAQLVDAESIGPADIGAVDERARARAVARLAVCVREAEQIGASRVGVMSGRDPFGGAQGADRAAALDSLVRSLVELAATTHLDLALMPFDRVPSPSEHPDAYKTALVGPVAEAVDVVRRARAGGAANVVLALDTAHLHENREGPDDVVAAGALDVLGLFHVSNCVVDPTAADAGLRLGDRHPRFGCADGAVGPDVLAAHARMLGEVGWSGPVVVEVRPLPQEDPWQVQAEARAAWAAAVALAG